MTGRSATREGFGVIGLGAAACVACCAGPILALLGGLTIAGLASTLVIGIGGLAVAVVAAVEMGARVYSPDIGRFLEVDPVRHGSANDYEYAAGDPINQSDRSGQWIPIDNSNSPAPVTAHMCPQCWAGPNQAFLSSVLARNFRDAVNYAVQVQWKAAAYANEMLWMGITAAWVDTIIRGVWKQIAAAVDMRVKNVKTQAAAIGKATGASGFCVLGTHSGAGGGCRGGNTVQVCSSGFTENFLGFTLGISFMGYGWHSVAFTEIMAGGGAVAVAEPTPIGEIFFAVTIVAVAGASCYAGSH